VQNLRNEAVVMRSPGKIEIKLVLRAEGVRMRGIMGLGLICQVRITIVGSSDFVVHKKLSLYL